MLIPKGAAAHECFGAQFTKTLELVIFILRFSSSLRAARLSFACTSPPRHRCGIVPVHEINSDTVRKMKRKKKKGAPQKKKNAKRER